ncbi:hypothetical protein L6259_04235 [Candidatus Parcubacteria bacterium]|nr:hypothetical protein [Patescibacteria group bacterium]MCG2694447.1 hypothetical protein [Candidatus Parcubacteria bacterium]
MAEYNTLRGYRVKGLGDRIKINIKYMVEKLIPEEVSALTGEDIEDVSDEEHPKGSLDTDMEGTGVDEPDLDSARFDTEIEEEDKGDTHLQGLDFDKLTPEDRDFYLEMVGLRGEYKELGASKELLARVDRLAEKIHKVSRELISDEGARQKFGAMINNKLTIISMETQMDLREK